MPMRASSKVSVLALASALGAVMAPVSAPAQHVSAAASARHLRTRAPGDTVLPVHTVLARDAGDGCTYRAEVRGTVAAAPLGRAVLRYLPDLRADAEVRCAGAVKARQSERVAGIRMDAPALEQAVESAGRVIGYAAGEPCGYSPDFSFVGGRLAGEWLTRACGIRAVSMAVAPVVLPVNAQFAQVLDDGCRYQVNVTGELYAAQDARAAEGVERYAPDLRVDTWLRCADGRVKFRTEAVRSAVSDPVTLERALEDAALLSTTHRDHRCTYWPELRVGRGMIEADTVASACLLRPSAVARGGGPR